MPVRITQAELREAVRDARYWTPGHPERAAFTAWVTDGFRALNPRDAAPRAAVWVKAYTRNGHTVSAHWRAAPPGDGATGTASHQASVRDSTGTFLTLCRLACWTACCDRSDARLRMDAGLAVPRVAEILASGQRPAARA